MTERVDDERFPEPDESQIQPGETRQEWTARNAAHALVAAKTPEAKDEAEASLKTVPGEALEAIEEAKEEAGEETPKGAK